MTPTMGEAQGSPPRPSPGVDGSGPPLPPLPPDLVVKVLPILRELRRRRCEREAPTTRAGAPSVSGPQKLENL
jgi:hypothetical protein